MTILEALTRIWTDLERVNDRPGEWDTTCEAMHDIMDELDVKYDENGDLMHDEI